MRSRYLCGVAIVLGGALAVVPAMASSGASPAVSGLESIMWSPAEVVVAPSGTVTFQDTSAVVPHGVVWEPGNPGTPVCSGVPIDEGKTDWKGTCTFTKAGTYSYYCSVHGMAMSGTVTVSPAGTTSATTSTPTTTQGSTTTTLEEPTSQTSPVPAPDAPPLGTVAKAIRVPASQHGRFVAGSLAISPAGVGARLEVDLLASGAPLGRARHQVRVGRLLRAALSAGSLSFKVPLSTLAEVALRHHRRLALTVKITLVPVRGATVRITRITVVHA